MNRDDSWKLVAMVAGAAGALALSCGGGSFPRDTTASNGRADDPWLEGGQRCAPGSPDDPGLRVETIEVGVGRAIGDGETVRVHYIASLSDGTVVHDTRADGLPIELIVGSTKIICGFERALIGMRAGDQRRVSVPWRLAFGESGKPPTVPPRSDLTFVVDLFLPADASQEHGSAPTRPPTSRGGGGAGRGAGGH